MTQRLLLTPIWLKDCSMNWSSICWTCSWKGSLCCIRRDKISKGLLPIDHYKPEVDDVCRPHCFVTGNPQNHCWRVWYGHSTLSAQMPSESSSVVCNATNWSPQETTFQLKSKKGTLKQIVPSYTLKNHILCCGSKTWMDTSTSWLWFKSLDCNLSNTSYNPTFWEEKFLQLLLLVISSGALASNPLLSKYLWWKKREKGCRGTPVSVSTGSVK